MITEFRRKHIELDSVDIGYWFFIQQNIPLVYYFGGIILITLMTNVKYVGGLRKTYELQRVKY